LENTLESIFKAYLAPTSTGKDDLYVANTPLAILTIKYIAFKN